ncbi:MAG: VCBS repeat-containing protein [Thermoanaerobaculia bacterium]
MPCERFLRRTPRAAPSPAVRARTFGIFGIVGVVGNVGTFGIVGLAGLVGVTLAFWMPSPSAGAPLQLALIHQRIELSGVPVKTLSIDLDRDGRQDLAVVVASTSWGELGFEESMQEGESGSFVDVLTVVPAVLDRRELLVFLGQRGEAGGGFVTNALRLELPAAVHAIEAGPKGTPLVAITDDGASAVEIGPAGVGSGDKGADPQPAAGADEPLAATTLVLTPLIQETTLFAGSGSFLPRSGLLSDLDGDGELDLLLPVSRGLAVYLSVGGCVGIHPSSFVDAPAIEPQPPALAEGALSGADDSDAERDISAPASGFGNAHGATSEIPLPEVVDLNGDHRPDLLYRDAARWRSGIRLCLNLGDGRFGAAIDPLPPIAARKAAATESEDEPAVPEIVWLGDLDGDGRAELVTSEEVRSGKDTMRAELAEAKRPHSRLRIHALRKDGTADPAVRSDFVIEGYLFDTHGSDNSSGSGDMGDASDDEGSGLELAFPSGVRDLDGDGKIDFVALTLDFSLFEAMRVLATKSIKLGLDFAIYHQGENLSFRPVPGLALSGVLRLHLDSASIGQLSSFSGDFDGDGRADFVQLGGGKKVSIHRGQPGARYAPSPDLVVTLEREPLDVALVAVNDFDGDGRSDLCVTQPLGGKEIGARAALDLYLSGAAAR